MLQGRLAWRAIGIALLLVGLGAFVLLFSDRADWTAPRREGSGWVGGTNTYFRSLVAGVCTLGGIGLLGRASGTGADKRP